jgi:hypothetical protein
VSDKPTLNDAFRALARAGSADSPAVQNLRDRWRDGSGSLSPERLLADPALQLDEGLSLIRSSGSLAEALAQYRAARRRLTVRQDPIRDDPKPTAAPIQWRLPFDKETR